MNPLLEKHRAKIAESCQRFGVERLAVFGSAARSDFRPETSDVDFLVRFRATREPGYADRYMDFAETLERLLGRNVDLMTERAVQNPYFRRQIERDAVVVYGDANSQAS